MSSLTFDIFSVTCCDDVVLSNTTLTFLSSGYAVLAGTCLLYSTTPTANSRKVYRLEGSSTAYCLSYGVSAWRVNLCATQIGSGSYSSKVLTH